MSNNETQWNPAEEEWPFEGDVPALPPKEIPAETTVGALASLANLLDATTKFHQLAGFPVGQYVVGRDGKTILGEAPLPVTEYVDMIHFRLNLMKEEYLEYRKGEFDEDLVEVVDGLLDIIVIAWGTLLTYVGPELSYAAAFEVARSNLSKVDGSLGPIVRREDGKILKPEGWEPPHIARALGLE